MALFISYAVIYLAIGAAIYEVPFVLYSYPNDGTETVIFDRPIHAPPSVLYHLCIYTVMTILLAITVVRAQLWWEDPSKRSRLKQVTHVSEG